MELKELFEMQRRLDEHIIKKKGLEGQDLLLNKILALLVELGEMTNELPEVFKHWSNKKNNYENALKEYIDCLHFILSIGLELGADKELDTSYRMDTFTSNVGIHIKDVFLRVIKLDTSLKTDFVLVAYEELTERFLGLGFLLGFTHKGIIKAYKDKNKVNHARQENGY